MPRRPSRATTDASIPVGRRTGLSQPTKEHSVQGDNWNHRLQPVAFRSVRATWTELPDADFHAGGRHAISPSRPLRPEGLALVPGHDDVRRRDRRADRAKDRAPCLRGGINFIDSADVYNKGRSE